MKKNMIIMLTCVGILFGGVAAYKIFVHFMMQRHIASLQNPVVTVSATEAKMTDWEPLIHSTGSTRTFKGVDITVETPGMIREIYFTSGQRVKKGDMILLQNIDDEVAQLKVLEADANVAAITYKRNLAQFKIGAVSRQQLDNDRANARSTSERVAEQKARIAKKKVKAPFSGKLGISAVDPGQFLNTGDKIVSLQTLHPIFVDVNLPQEVLSKVKVGQPVEVTVDAFPNKKFVGKLTTINPEVNSSTRNFEAEATIENEEELLLPGMFTHATITVGAPSEKLALPVSAVTFNPYGEAVFVLTKEKINPDGKQIWKAKETFIETGEQRGNQIIVAKGIKEGQMIVTSGQLKLRSGSLVKINNTVEPSNNPNPEVTNG